MAVCSADLHPLVYLIINLLIFLTTPRPLPRVRWRSITNPAAASFIARAGRRRELDGSRTTWRVNEATLQQSVMLVMLLHYCEGHMKRAAIVITVRWWWMHKKINLQPVRTWLRPLSLSIVYYVHPSKTSSPAINSKSMKVTMITCCWNNFREAFIKQFGGCLTVALYREMFLLYSLLYKLYMCGGGKRTKCINQM